jgi:hypothetical protein
MDCLCSRFAGMTSDDVERIASLEYKLLLTNLPILTNHPVGVECETMKRVGIRLGFRAFQPERGISGFLAVAFLFHRCSCLKLDWFYSPKFLKTLSGMVIDGMLETPNRYTERKLNRDPTPIRRRCERKMELLFDRNIHRRPTKDMVCINDLPDKTCMDMKKNISKEVRHTFNECWNELYRKHHM